jgi:hypothetical protein
MPASSIAPPESRKAIAAAAEQSLLLAGLAQQAGSLVQRILVSVTALASALRPAVRDGFLQLIASKLAAYPPQVRGLGLVRRLAAEAQRDFLNVAVGADGRGRRHG